MRQLASIQRITSLSPITGADMIEKATILGWELVVAKKDNFKVNDLCVYCEIDSILPDRPEFEFLRERKFRVRTIKLKGQISQGIAFPLSILPKGNYKEGQDVTDLLGVKKYDPQAEAEKKEADRLMTIDKSRMRKFMMRYGWFRRFVLRPGKIPFPSFIKKTDEDRIQLFPNYYEKWGNLKFTVTEKIDGQSGTFFCVWNSMGLFRKEWIFGVCSRNFQLLKPDDSSYWTIGKQIKDRMIAWCKASDKGLIIQGEIISDKIQGGKYKRGGYEFFVFNIIIYDKGKKDYLDQTEQSIFCRNQGLVPVPVVKFNMPLLPTMSEMVSSANGTSYLAPVLREGLVWRNYEAGISFKVVSPEFLLKHGE